MVGFRVLLARLPDGKFRIGNPLTRAAVDETAETITAEWSGELVLVTRRWGGAGVAPASFGFRWFLPSLWRYRKPLGHVLIASLFVQLFALVTPLLFQVVIDKVLVHKGFSTLMVIVDRPGRDRLFRHLAAVFAILRPQSYDEPDRRRTWQPAVRSPVCAYRSPTLRHDLPGRPWRGCVSSRACATS